MTRQSAPGAIIIPKEGPHNRHPLSQRFHQLLTEIGELHDSKQADYGLPGDPFANLRSSEDWGAPAWVGTMMRGGDKIKRLQTFARTGKLSNESAADSFKDLAVYALAALVLFEQQQRKTNEERQRFIDSLPVGGA